jgi:hypothetical protein
MRLDGFGFGVGHRQAGVGETLRAQDGGFLLALRLADLRFAVPLGFEDGSALGRFGVGDGGAALALGAHLQFHRLLDVARAARCSAARRA